MVVCGAEKWFFRAACLFTGKAIYVTVGIPSLINNCFCGNKSVFR